MNGILSPQTKLDVELRRLIIGVLENVYIYIYTK
jgi:hypothetical protein